jgi:diacylglycerol kinase family enzyme
MTSMRICLFWNESAGEGASLDELVALIGKAGHRVDRVVEDVSGLPAAIDSVDCVVAAGGDGTVARAGRALAGGRVPLAILPLGTANNIASSLGIDGSPRELIARWANQRLVTIDIGVMRSGKGESYFLESVGTGLVAAGIAEGQATLSKDDPDEHLLQARRMYLDTIQHLSPRHRRLTIDGESMDGDYLLVEVLNTPSIGPGIRLSPDVNAADGLLSVVAAGEADRDALASYVQARTRGNPADAGLKSWPAGRVELAGMDDMHVDDEVREGEGDAVTVTIKPGFLRVLG